MIPSINLAIVLAEIALVILYYLHTKKIFKIKTVTLAGKLVKIILLPFIFIPVGFIIRKFIENDFVIIFGFMPLWVGLYLLAARYLIKDEINIALSK